MLKDTEKKLHDRGKKVNEYFSPLELFFLSITRAPRFSSLFFFFLSLFLSVFSSEDKEVLVIIFVSIFFFIQNILRTYYVNTRLDIKTLFSRGARDNTRYNSYFFFFLIIVVL